MQPRHTPKKVQELARIVLDVHPHLGRVVRAEIRSSTGRKLLTLPQYRVLEEIRSGNQHLSNLSKKHRISQPAMSKLVEAVVKNGYVERSEDKSDRRQSKLKLTPLGHRVYERARTLALATMTQKLMELKKSDVQFVQEAFERLAKIFEAKKDEG